MYKIIIRCKRSDLSILLQTNIWPISILEWAFPLMMYDGHSEFAEVIRIFASDTNICIRYLDEEHYVDNENQLLFIMCEAISHIIDVRSSDYAVWHGGMIARGELAIAMLAGTRTGKSTLISNFLKNAEYQYLSDDIILYDEIANKVIPYPMPLKLREISYMPQELHDRVIAQGYNVLSGEMEYYISGNVQFENIRDVYELGAFIVLDRLESGSGSINRLPYQEAAKALILNGRKAGYIHIRNLSKLAVNIARCVPVYLLRYVSTDEGVMMVRAVMSNRLKGEF